MTSSVSATLIVDTNLFLECQPLRQIPWKDLGFKEILLIVPRPVQQEIDNHKKGIKGRTFKKALEVTKIFREILISEKRSYIVQEDSPRVILKLMEQSKIDPTLAKDLDPDLNDDAIILRMLQYARNNPSEDVRLLTHDTGPMATVQSIGEKFIVIPDKWLSNEHDDPVVKEIKKLESDLKRLRSQEPDFSTSAHNRAGAYIERLEAEVEHYEELSAEEINLLLTKLQEKYPVENDFGSPEKTPRPPTLITMRITEFQSAKTEDIKTYQDEQYPKWLERCRTFFEQIHHTLNRYAQHPVICFKAENTGTRPAAQSLIRFEAVGDINILPAPDDEGDTATKKSPQIPSPPPPPRGKWIERSALPFDFMFGLGGPADIRHHLEPQLNLANLVTKPRDPDAFYWKDGRPALPTNLIELTCKNWRHSVGEEIFDFEIYPCESAEATGAVKVEIHADNLTDPMQMTIPVSIKKISKSTFKAAQELIDHESYLSSRKKFMT